MVDGFHTQGICCMFETGCGARLEGDPLACVALADRGDQIEDKFPLPPTPHLSLLISESSPLVIFCTSSLVHTCDCTRTHHTRQPRPECGHRKYSSPFKKEISQSRVVTTVQPTANPLLGCAEPKESRLDETEEPRLFCLVKARLFGV